MALGLGAAALGTEACGPARRTAHRESRRRAEDEPTIDDAFMTMQEAASQPEFVAVTFQEFLEDDEIMPPPSSWNAEELEALEKRFYQVKYDLEVKLNYQHPRHLEKANFVFCTIPQKAYTSIRALTSGELSMEGLMLYGGMPDELKTIFADPDITFSIEIDPSMEIHKGDIAYEKVTIKYHIKNGKHIPPQAIGRLVDYVVSGVMD